MATTTHSTPSWYAGKRKKKSKTEHRENSCLRKPRYDSYMAAWKFRKQTQCDIYKCDYCNGYHISHKMIDKMTAKGAFDVALDRAVRRQIQAENN